MSSRKVDRQGAGLLSQAKNYAFLLLKFRLRSEGEIYQRLKKKKFKEEVIRQTIEFLKEKGFIDDAVFARGWIESRLKRPFGLRRIRQELKTKGLKDEVIESGIQEAKGNYSEEEVVSVIAKNRFDRMKDAEPAKAKRRLYAYLLRRGFSPEIVTDVLSRL